MRRCGLIEKVEALRRVEAGELHGVAGPSRQDGSVDVAGGDLPTVGERVPRTGSVGGQHGDHRLGGTARWEVCPHHGAAVRRRCRCCPRRRGTRRRGVWCDGEVPVVGAIGIVHSEVAGRHRARQRGEIVRRPPERCRFAVDVDVAEQQRAGAPIDDPVGSVTEHALSDVLRRELRPADDVTRLAARQGKGVEGHGRVVVLDHPVQDIAGTRRNAGTDESGGERDDLWGITGRVAVDQGGGRGNLVDRHDPTVTDGDQGHLRRVGRCCHRCNRRCGIGGRRDEIVDGDGIAGDGDRRFCRAGRFGRVGRARRDDRGRCGRHLRRCATGNHTPALALVGIDDESDDGRGGHGDRCAEHDPSTRISTGRPNSQDGGATEAQAIES